VWATDEFETRDESVAVTCSHTGMFGDYRSQHERAMVLFIYRHPAIGPSSMSEPDGSTLLRI
jgi:hypothetical protein